MTINLVFESRLDRAWAVATKTSVGSAFVRQCTHAPGVFSVPFIVRPLGPGAEVTFTRTVLK